MSSIRLFFTMEANAKMMPIIIMAPMNAANIVARKPLKTNSLLPNPMTPPHANMLMDTPIDAPFVIPRIDGPASGLWKAVCRSNPEAAREAPQSSAVMVCGSRESVTIYAQLAFSTGLPRMALNTWSMGMSTEPTIMLNATAISAAMDSNMLVFNALEIS